jgi:hypothetical protein
LRSRLLEQGSSAVPARSHKRMKDFLGVISILAFCVVLTALAFIFV